MLQPRDPVIFRHPAYLEKDPQKPKSDAAEIQHVFLLIHVHIVSVLALPERVEGEDGVAGGVAGGEEAREDMRSVLESELDFRVEILWTVFQIGVQHREEARIDGFARVGGYEVDAGGRGGCGELPDFLLELEGEFGEEFKGRGGHLRSFNEIRLM